MGSTVKKIAIGAAVIGAAFATGGASLAPSFAGFAGAGAGIAAGTLTTTALGSALLLAGGSQIALGLASAAGLGPKKPTLDSGGFRSRVEIDPQREQWAAVGQTALPAVMIHADTEGADNSVMSQVFVHNCYAVSNLIGVYINNVATTISPNVTGPYEGVLSVEFADGTQTGNPFSAVAGGLWGSGHIGRGLCMSHFKWTYDAEKLAAGLPQSIQIVANGLAVYDPRRDTTRGGSGSMRADDPSTWTFDVSGTAIGRNPALVELTYRLGWQKNGRLWLGMGEDPANIDYPSYIAAANICEETVNGKQRYAVDGILSLSATHNENLGRILATCAGRSIDQGGLVAIWVANDDTASPVFTLGPGDFKTDISMTPLPEGNLRNTGRGKFIDPASFYQAIDYPEVVMADALAQDNGIEQLDDLSFDMIQDVDQARRVAAIRIMESRQGPFTTVTDLRGLQLRPADIIELDHPRWGWSGKPFRVEGLALTPDWQVRLSLSAVASADYADLANETIAAAGTPNTAGYIPILGGLAGLDAVDLADGAQVLNRVATNITETTTRKWAGETGATVGGTVGTDIKLPGGAVAGLGHLLNSAILPGNLFTDPTFERFVAGGGDWSAFAGAIGTELVPGSDGTNGFYLVLPANASDRYGQTPGRTIRAGTRIDAAIEVRDFGNTTGAVGIYYACFDSAFSVVDDDWLVYVPHGLADPTVWQTFADTLILPPNTETLFLRVQAEGGHDATFQVRGPRAYDSEKALQYLAVNGRATRSRIFHTSGIIGVPNTVSAQATASDQGGGTGVTITIPAHSRKISDTVGAETISYNGGTVTNRNYDAIYHVYADDPDLVGGAVTYQASPDADDLHGAGRYHVTTITTPVNGGASTGGSGGGGSVRPLNPGENIP